MKTTEQLPRKLPPLPLHIVGNKLSRLPIQQLQHSDLHLTRRSGPNKCLMASSTVTWRHCRSMKDCASVSVPSLLATQTNEVRRWWDPSPDKPSGVATCSDDQNSTQGQKRPLYWLSYNTTTSGAGDKPFCTSTKNTTKKQQTKHVRTKTKRKKQLPLSRSNSDADL